MSDRTLDEIAASARDTALRVAWAQWSALGTMASSTERATSIVDPEALLLVSLALRGHEPRLWDVLDQWAKTGVRLLSVQRVKNLVTGYPPETRDALSEFVALIGQHGRDARWKPKFFGTPPHIRPVRGKRLEMNLAFPRNAALMLRLRRGFGVNLRADALSFLLCNSARPSSVRAIARSLHYTEVAIRRVLDDLVGARLVQPTMDDRPTAYCVATEAWMRLLELSSTPSWHHWHEIFVLVARLDAWARQAHDKMISGYALDALGLEFLGHHRAAFVRNGVSFSPQAGALGLDIAGDDVAGEPVSGRFDELVSSLTRWALEAV